jgi:hypothetical protein
MAVKSKETSKIILKVENGIGKDGSPAFAQRTFQHINPALSDDDAYTIGEALAGLQTHTLGTVLRTDNASLIAG